jgi:hypothetical protein
MRPLALIRTFLVALAIFFAAFFLPAHGAWPVTVGFLAAILAATAMAPAAVQGYLRRNRLRATIARELTKLRRVYHLGRHLGESSETMRPWFTELHGRLYNYLSFFGSKEYAGYDSTDKLFRQVSYHVYGIPEPTSAKQQQLYAELLDSVAEAAEAREQLKSLLVDALPRSEVLALGFGVGVTLCAVVANPGVTSWDRALAAFLAFSVYLGYERLVDLDGLADVTRAMPARYAANLTKLEFRNREEEK